MQSFAGFFRKNVKSISAGYGRGVLIGARVRKIFREKVSGGGRLFRTKKVIDICNTVCLAPRLVLMLKVENVIYDDLFKTKKLLPFTLKCKGDLNLNFA